MQFKYSPAPHYHSPLSTERIMRDLTIGLSIIYAFALYKAYLLGTSYLVNALALMASALITAIVTESIYAKFVKQPVVPYLKHSFGWVTAMILVLMVPVNTRLYAMVIGTFSAIYFGKLVFGGFGQNVFNPAGVGRAFMLISFASAMKADLVTSATPTSTLSSAGWLLSAEGFETFLSDFGGLGNLFFGNYAGAMGETSTLLIILMGIYFAVREVIDWRVPVTYIGIIFLTTLCIGLSHGLGLEYALFHCLTGGAMFGAVFMLTDPVTNPNTRAGRIVFAASAAFITLIIRFFANLPEGVLFSILLVNMLTPAIDKYFDGKQILMEKKIKYTVVGLILGVIGLVFLLTNGMAINSQYKSINTPELDYEVSGTMNLNDDLSKYSAEILSVEGNAYRVSTKGFGKLNMPESEEFKENIFDVVIENQKIVSVEFVQFGDTVGFGDKCVEESYLLNLTDKGLTDDVDLIASATYTSESVAAAIQAALNAAAE